MYFIVLRQATALVCNPCKVKERFLISQKFGIFQAISLPLSPSLSCSFAVAMAHEISLYLTLNQVFENFINLKRSGAWERERETEWEVDREKKRGVGERQPATKLFTRNFIKTINHAVETAQQRRRQRKQRRRPRRRRRRRPLLLATWRQVDIWWKSNQKHFSAQRKWR